MTTFDVIGPLLLVGVGGAAIVVTRGWQWVLGALLAQWLGLVWIAASAWPEWAIPAIELATALVCIAILAVTEQRPKGSRSTQTGETLNREESHWERQWRLAQERERPHAPQGAEGTRLRTQVERLWLLVTVLAGAVAGFGLARIYPLGASDETLLAFYWTVLAGVLALVMDGSRNHTKLAAGLLVLMNGVALLVIAVSGATPGPLTLLLLSMSRVALALVLAASWSVMRAAFDEADVSTLFNVRSGTHTALVPVAAVEAPVAAQPESPIAGDEKPNETQEEAPLP